MTITAKSDHATSGGADSVPRSKRPTDQPAACLRARYCSSNSILDLEARSIEGMEETENVKQPEAELSGTWIRLSWPTA